MWLRVGHGWRQGCGGGACRLSEWRVARSATLHACRAQAEPARRAAGHLEDGAIQFAAEDVKVALAERTCVSPTRRAALG